MQLFAKYNSNPKKLLLIDSWGAGLTILVLALILEPFQKEFGMPLVVLRIFSTLACIFFIYSLISFYFGDKKHAFLLKLIAFGNTFYSFLITFFMVRYYEKLTTLGLSYFLCEIVVILGLVFWELRTAYKPLGK